MKLSASLAWETGSFSLDVAFELTGHAALLGPNGSGKSTVLDLLSGLRKPHRGRVAIDDEVLLDTTQGRSLPPAERRIGQVLQDGALFPHLTVAQNVAYPLTVRRRRDDRRVADLLARFDLASLAEQLPATLSGGERQRSALARALAASPRWLLLDEPFAALDAAARPALRQELLAILDEQGVPALMVTHEARDALGLGGRVLVIEHGRLVEQGAAADLLHRPTSSFGAALAGLNYLLGVVAANHDGLLDVRVGQAILHVPGDRPVGATVAVVVNPTDIILSDELPHTSAQNHFRGTVASLQSDGPGYRVTVEGELTLTAWVTPASVAELGLKVASPVTALFKTPAARLC